MVVALKELAHLVDLRAAHIDEVREFFQRYYHPANASLALAGDIRKADAFELAERYFGEIPAGPVPAPVSARSPVVAEDRRFVLEDRVELPRLYLAWPSPALFADGDA